MALPITSMKAGTNRTRAQELTVRNQWSAVPLWAEPKPMAALRGVI